MNKKKLQSFVKRYQWWLLGIGFLVFTSAAVIQYYSRSMVLEHAEATAAKSLKNIVDESYVMVSKVEMAADALKIEIEQNLNDSERMFQYSRQVLEQNDMVKGCSVSFEPYYYPERGKYFSAYSYSGGKEIATEQEGDDEYQYFVMDWYLIPRQLDRKYWIEPYEESSTDGIIVKDIMTSYCQPIHNQRDSVVGVLSVDIPLKWLSDFINKQQPITKSYCMLLGRGGTYIVHPNHDKLLYETILTPTLEQNDPDLNKLGRAMISGETGSQTLVLDGEKSHVFFMPFARTGWSLALVCPEKALLINYYIVALILLVVMTLAALAMLMPVCCKLHCKICGESTAVLLVLLLAACQQPEKSHSIQANVHRDETLAKTDTLIRQVEDTDEKQFFALVDSLETIGTLTAEEANYYRGDHYDTKGQLRTAVMYLKKALADDILLKHNPLYFYKTSNVMIVSYFNINNLEESIEVATKAYEVASKDTTLQGQNYANIFLMNIGNCQLSTGRVKECSETYEKVRQNIIKLCQEHPNDRDCLENALVIGCNVANMYMNQNKYDILEPWFALIDESLAGLAGTDASMKTYERFVGWSSINKAVMLYMTNRKEEAEMLYQKYKATEYAKSYNAIYDEIYYLQTTEQWNRALELYKNKEKEIIENSSTVTLDNLINDYGPIFQTYLKTGHKEEALEKAIQIIDLMDTVNISQNKSNAAELAVIYETQQKEEQIAQQRTSLAQQRSWTFALVFGLLTIAFAVILMLRHKAAKHLEVEHEKLLKAYDQLEETTTVKERIESELRIARDIQMSMVPSSFPEREGLEMYASMTPAREVGGDLYDYLLQDDTLYFCVGDVSGKGVPASLFMAQTIRLFRAMAKQHQLPAYIATELNAELSENNENGMFVTMFIGLLDLKTGHLQFCNAGHNPPVIGGDAQHGSYLKMESNAPIGLWENLKYIGEEIDTIKGRPLFVYTDGLNEAENQQKKQLGEKEVLRILRETHYNNPQQVIATLTAAVEKHRCGAEPNDDLTMMCIKVQ